MSELQQNRGLNITTTAGADKLLLSKLVATERLGQLFEFDVELLSTDHNIDLSGLLGTGATIELELSSGDKRYLHGLFGRLSWAGSHGHFSKYRATIVPWFWMLTKTANCRIYQNKTVVDIITDIFKNQNQFSDFSKKLSGTHGNREYCVQYCETDFQFVSRLMEEEGIYYFFEHSEGKHDLVLCDSASGHKPSETHASLAYFPPEARRIAEYDHVYHWDVSMEVQSGEYVLANFDFEKPKADLTAKAMIQRDHALSGMEVFNYPGAHTELIDGESRSKVRIQERQSQFVRSRGTTNARGLSVGSTFKLTGHLRSDQNAEYLVVASRIEAQNSDFETGEDTETTEFKCDFEAMDYKQVFRAPSLTPRPMIRGPQTAIVVGKSGEEVWTDKYGRVKVHFHWDRFDKQDENSSCWVRVAQSWAGKRWGSIHIPRIGQEVIVEFLEGDPDRPIVTGRVYNADEMPPYALPENGLVSGIKSHSSKDATDENFNALTFNDTKGKEEVYFHAEKDFQRHVENNDSLKVGFDKMDPGDQKIEIFNNQEVIVGGSDADDGSQTVTVFNNFTHKTKEGDATIAVEKGSRKTTIETDETLEVTSGDRKTTVKSGDDTLSIDSGSQTTEAANKIQLKVGSSSITILPDKISICSPTIELNADTAVKIESGVNVDVAGAVVSVAADGSLKLEGGVVNIN
ncbi:type VI secretion system tip protein VgrG [Stieleria sp. JC731]|uniref:type VI secretion system Vgr family protein n=1 Tax=Pirellulaceae TaxID=2691357 RepID=UPI001E5ECCBF|nr:type VI secretion system tip protein VgrG [Stieleria sp. JC731]MCC9603159.1 type VI secretion system tip protein VgrG [Stieleria sp. JC731]